LVWHGWSTKALISARRYQGAAEQRPGCGGIALGLRGRIRPRQLGQLAAEDQAVDRGHEPQRERRGARLPFPAGQDLPGRAFPQEVCGGLVQQRGVEG